MPSTSLRCSVVISVTLYFINGKIWGLEKWNTIPKVTASKQWRWWDLLLAARGQSLNSQPCLYTSPSPLPLRWHTGSSFRHLLGVNISVPDFCQNLLLMPSLWGKLAFSREAFSTSVTKHPPAKTAVDSHPQVSSHSTQQEQQNCSEGLTRCTIPSVTFQQAVV